MLPVGPWILRDGQGGGKRVSAATQRALLDTPDIDQAEARDGRMGQQPLFMIREGDEAWIVMLADTRLCVLDPVTVYACPVRS